MNWVAQVSDEDPLLREVILDLLQLRAGGERIRRTGQNNGKEVWL